MNHIDELRQKAAIAALGGLLANPTLVDRMMAEDAASIAADEDFDPLPNRISDLAIEVADALIRRLVDR